MSWVCEVCTEMRFQRLTFHSALSYIDQYFSKASYIISVDEFQILGVTCIWVAAKMEEIFVPAVKYFSKATGSSSSEIDIAEMERKLLLTLRFKMNPVTMVQWADWYTKQWDSYAS